MGLLIVYAMLFLPVVVLVTTWPMSAKKTYLALGLCLLLAGLFGWLVFLVVEGITRKRIPPEKEGYVHALGLMLLFGFMLFITYKDIIRLIAG